MEGEEDGEVCEVPVEPGLKGKPSRERRAPRDKELFE